jgi:hypothetical protein
MAFVKWITCSVSESDRERQAGGWDASRAASCLPLYTSEKRRSIDA